MENDKVTILIYTFPKRGCEKSFFSKIEAAILRTWRLIGDLKTVIVASHRFPEVENFAFRHTNVELQVEPSLLPGDIQSMSRDCIIRLHRRFSTPYVLIIQDDGFPIRSNLEDFIDKGIDFWGAPLICDGWKRKLAYALGFGSYNGGFSLRTRTFCEYAASKYRFFLRFLPETHHYFAEDYYYTVLLRIFPATWFRFRFPSERDAFRFAVDRLGGCITPPRDVNPFGVHGHGTLDFLEKQSLLGGEKSVQ